MKTQLNRFGTEEQMKALAYRGKVNPDGRIQLPKRLRLSAKGDVVLAAFPLSDVSSATLWPGLVLFDSGDENALLARITICNTTSGEEL